MILPRDWQHIKCQQGVKILYIELVRYTNIASASTSEFVFSYV